jgi:L-fuculose-phosphate aldolase
MSHELRQQLIDTALDMNARGLNQGTSGNLSVRHGDGMLITPSSMDYASLKTDDIVHLDLDGNSTSVRRPSSEWRFHARIYKRRPEAQAVLHAHPLNCSALACMGKGIPAFHYNVAVAGGNDIRCARYETFGTQELSDAMLEALEGRKACLMANHGMTCVEKDLPTVLDLAVEVENLAAVYGRILAMGKANILDDAEMDRVIRQFGCYAKQT